MNNPYTNLSKNNFWKPAIADVHFSQINELFNPKFKINSYSKVSTYGSCFAQHISKSLIKNGFNWINAEPAPYGLKEKDCQEYNYNVYSSRTGNIYTTSLLNQWCEWVSNEKLVEELEFYEESNRFFDPFRPNIEPNGFLNKIELINSRLQTVKSFRESIKSCNLFIFTLGLTESWFDQSGNEYPACPGTIVGKFDSSKHLFINQNYDLVHKKLSSAIRHMKSINPEIKILLTVSPVPLTATNSNKHVLVATNYSKSVLRAVAGDLANNYDYIEYFPSFEIINSHPFRAIFYDPNLRTVNKFGVDFVMKHFLKNISETIEANEIKLIDTKRNSSGNDNVVCEEELLESFLKNNHE